MKNENMTKYPENVILAFLTTRRTADIAKQTGLSQRTIERYKKDPELQKILRDRQAEMFKDVTDTLQKILLPAITELEKIIKDPEVVPQTKIYAINSLFQQFRSMTEIADIQARLTALEDAKGEIDELWRKIQGVRHG